MRATISPRPTSSERSFTATTPPNCMVMFCRLQNVFTFFAHFAAPPSACAGAAGAFFRFLKRVRQFLLAHQALAEEQHDDHDDDREHDQPETAAEQARLNAEELAAVEAAQPPLGAGYEQEAGNAAAVTEPRPPSTTMSSISWSWRT